MRYRFLPAAVAAALACAAAPAHANSVPRWDRHFLLDTAEGAHFEIDAGKIAEKNAATAEGRAAGRLMAKDHSGELHAIEALAKRLGVTLPNHPSALERHEISGVTAHHGAAFDRAYARLEVADHIGDIQTADGERLEGGMSSVKAFAAKYREMYGRHLSVFRKLATDVHAW